MRNLPRNAQLFLVVDVELVLDGVKERKRFAIFTDRHLDKRLDILWFVNKCRTLFVYAGRLMQYPGGRKNIAIAVGLRHKVCR